MISKSFWRDLVGGAIVRVATFPPQEGESISGMQGSASQMMDRARNIPGEILRRELQSQIRAL
jgi:hypothetical protein